MTSDSFSQLNLSEPQVANLESLGYRHMTPVQAAATPGALNGEDMIAQAKTGSGKTAVFGLTILAKLDLAQLHPQALILCPTRELSVQVSTEVRRLARHQQNVKVTTVYGGQPISLQKLALKHGTHIVIGTPGRIRDHLEKGSLELGQVTTLVLDEADRMLEMGFIEAIEAIISATPKSRQTLLYSATFPDNIQALSARFQKNPTRVSVDTHHDPSAIRQQFFACEFVDKPAALKTLLLQHQPTSAVVFCNLKQTTRDIGDFLHAHGFSALVLNGDLEQREREEILIRFKHQSASVLVATDVAARGLDIKELPAVINFELPPDPEVYVHRIGRTGRAGHTGVSLSLCTERERHKLKVINGYQRTAFECEPMAALHPKAHRAPPPPYVTFCISGGRRDKLRPGEILGALTAPGGIEGKAVGKIDVMDYASYVAITRDVAAQAGQQLKRAKIKGRSYKIRPL